MGCLVWYYPILPNFEMRVNPENYTTMEKKPFFKSNGFFVLMFWVLLFGGMIAAKILFF